MSFLSAASSILKYLTSHSISSHHSSHACPVEIALLVLTKGFIFRCLLSNEKNWVFKEIQKIRFFCRNRSCFSDKIRNTRFFSRKTKFSDEAINWSEKPDFSARNQKFLLQILKYRKTRFFSDSEILHFSALKIPSFLISFF